MPFLLLVILALAAGTATFLAALRYPTASGEAPPVTAAVGRELGREARLHPFFRRLLRGRLDPSTATGLALTLALAIAIVGGLLVGSLAYLMRSSGYLVSLDTSVGEWGTDHATTWSTNLLQLVTDLGSTVAMVVVVAVVAAVEMRRVPNHWVLPFLLTVVAGEILLVNSVKEVLDRVRPTFNPVAETLGPSFPSGHSATAAALYASVALVLARRRSPLVRALLAGGAVAIAVGVAWSRVMLGVHWLSDVVAGLAFGWAWFSVCAIAFGGRFLSFAAPLEEATAVAEAVPERSEVVEVALQRADKPTVSARDTR
jgi:undecaprenyl-diphosphatase